ncbi:MAG: ribosomal L7Ae/L30e/S12e/Gadd45 family protein [Candidatus Aenigmarchaeota archaeon]|nr:ribosomal L7Ae/L30e/S12e/Gadd45 family protein [Candidatus Aenigmarchaeota archaeon]
MEVKDSIKAAMKEQKIVLGSRQVESMAKKSELIMIIYASNIPENTKRDLKYYNKNFGIDIKMFTGNSRQLGEFCGKPFNVITLGIKK